MEPRNETHCWSILTKITLRSYHTPVHFLGMVLCSYLPIVLGCSTHTWPRCWVIILMPTPNSGLQCLYLPTLLVDYVHSCQLYSVSIFLPPYDPGLQHSHLPIVLSYNTHSCPLSGVTILIPAHSPGLPQSDLLPLSSAYVCPDYPS